MVAKLIYLSKKRKWCDFGWIISLPNDKSCENLSSHGQDRSVHLVHFLITDVLDSQRNSVNPLVFIIIVVVITQFVKLTMSAIKLNLRLGFIDISNFNVFIFMFVICVFILA